MTRELEVIHHDSLPVPDNGRRRAIGPAQDDGALAPAQEANSLAKVHRLLRGRYLLTFMLAAALGIGAALVGYFLWKPKYQAIAQVRVAPILPRILYKSEQNDVMPMYDGYISSQMAMMESQRVIDRAMRKPLWRDLDRGLGDQETDEFRKSTGLQRERNSQIISIRFVDATPDAAQAGAKSIVEAYMEIFGEEDIKRRELQLNVLEQRRTALINQTVSVRDRIMEIANAYGSDSLNEAYLSKMEELYKIESALKEVQLQLADTVATVEKGDVSKPVRHLSPQELAINDRMMEKLVNEREAVELEIKELLYYRTEDHPMVKRARSRLTNIAERITAYGSEYNRDVIEARADSDPIDSAIRQFELLASKSEQIRQLAEATRREALEVGRKDLEISRLQTDMVASEKRLEETDSRIEQLNVESSVSGRISVLSPGDRPGLPSNTSQRIQLTALGGATGSALGVGVMLLLGMANRRYRYADETRDGMPNVHVLGVIPELAAQSAGDQAKIAAMSIHQIRARLQMDGLGAHRRVYAITSAGASEGKTSVAAALGLSLAASGTRTLIVDFDLQGQGLSDCVGIRMQLGDLLVREGKLDAAKLAVALRRSARRRERLGDVLVELGYAKREEVEAAATKQSELNRGLADVLAGDDMARCVVTDLPDSLSILPVGNTDGNDVSTLSPSTIKVFIERLKKDYDVILFDCGPSPASLDASLIVPHADGVLFVVSQGSRQDGVQRAFTHLESLNARLSGVIFNRATWRDIERYGSQSRVSQNRHRSTDLCQTVANESAAAEPLGRWRWRRRPIGAAASPPARRSCGWTRSP